MTKQLLLFSILFSTVFQGLSRDLSFNATADRLFSDSAYRAIIREQCRLILRPEKISAADFASNYEAHENEIVSASSSLIEKKFSETERRILKQKIKDKIALPLFETAISNALGVTLAQDPELRASLTKKDMNDRILSFDSRIKIEQSGLIIVEETIVIANFNDESGNSNNTIKRGITRDFPTRYATQEGFMSSVPFELLSVSRNGGKENYKRENLTNGYRIYCGRSDYLLEEGKHTYLIKYTTGRQIKFHADRDEFYWNVTGNGWSFSIDKAACEIIFPQEAVTSDLNCYTGGQGSKEKKCQAESFARNSAQFFTRNRLEPYEGLTVSVSVYKGILIPETQSAAIQHFVKDNLFIIALVLFVTGLFIVLFTYWRRVGRDPEQGVVIPEFAPPAGLSPAEAGYIYHQAYNDKLLTAALIDLAVQKKLHIEVDREGIIFKSNVYKFSAPAADQQKVSGSDYDLYSKYGFDAADLFGIEIERGKYNARFANINRRFKNHLDSKILTERSKNKSKGFLSMNQGYIGLGLFLLIALSIGSVIYVSIYQPPLKTMLYAAILLLAGFIIQIVFMKIMKAYSPEGRMMADHLLGFRMYMGTTEKHILDHMNPPEENIQLFEKFLPYAIALDVENKWSEKFKAIIEQSIQSGYQPSYYSMGTHGSFGSSSQSFASALSSGLSNTVSSASTPPSSSSSSGSGVGGSSGGGGGGGGGGGW